MKSCNRRSTNSKRTANPKKTASSQKATTTKKTTTRKKSSAAQSVASSQLPTSTTDQTDPPQVVSQRRSSRQRRSRTRSSAASVTAIATLPPQLATYTVDHLFLLMGENPLPNSVAALTLLNPDGIPYLIHTNRTQRQAERLAQVLQPHYPAVHLIDLADNQAEAAIIRLQIQAIAQSLSGRLGMNYTGGTKAMSVHAYRTLAALQPSAVFSYLDSNTLEMVIDNDNGAGIRFKVSPQLSLEQLFQLHGLHWRSDRPPLQSPIQAEAATVLTQLFQNSRAVKSWRLWRSQHLWVVAKEQIGEASRWREESELRRSPLLSLRGLAPPFQDLLQQYLGAAEENFALQVAARLGFTSVTQVCEWLDGIWLEHYVLAQVQAIAPSCEIHESRMSLHIQEISAVNPGRDKFEFDVAFMRHYQLFALSCTTSGDRKLCKQKLMEASQRARQLGGAEARVGLVCGHHDAESLRSELEVATKNHKIAVFGRKDWQRLGEGIREWVAVNG